MTHLNIFTGFLFKFKSSLLVTRDFLLNIAFLHDNRGFDFTCTIHQDNPSSFYSVCSSSDNHDADCLSQGPFRKNAEDNLVSPTSELRRAHRLLTSHAIHLSYLTNRVHPCDRKLRLHQTQCVSTRTQCGRQHCCLSLSCSLQLSRGTVL